jgi:hypothetical protein
MNARTRDVESSHDGSPKIRFIVQTWFTIPGMLSRFILRVLLVVTSTLGGCALPPDARPADQQYFTIEVIDEQTGRGVPLVELTTTNHVRHYTDSAGIIAFPEPGLMNTKVFFHVASHGYEFPKDGFGYRGVALDVKPGGRAQIKIKRINIAERLYRITGQGIYRDSVLVGRRPPIDQPLLNAQVMGQDSVFAIVYRDKIYWFWGDTARVAYPLGLFAVAGATSQLPGNGGLAASAGVNLEYFTGEDGFARKMAPLFDQPYPIWIDGLITLPDDSGRVRMVAHWSQMKSLGERIARGLVVFNDDTQTFEMLKQFALNIPIGPAGHATRVTVDGVDYFYFASPYPSIRVRADWQSVQDPATYESLTPLRAGTRYEQGSTQLDRDSHGSLVYTWKRNTPPLSVEQERELIEAGLMREEESPFRIRDVASNQPVHVHGSTVHWNPFRKRWIMVFAQFRGTSNLGEIWYSEAERPEGPWTGAIKILTHDKMDFYNPAHHPFFDEDGGRYIYFEGTYTNTFSGNPAPTPRYEYNQIMYRLDLADPRLRHLDGD